MGRLSEYEEWETESEQQHDRDRYREIDALLSNPREEYLTRAYIDGRNVARDGKYRTNITDLYACDPLAAVNWEVGYDDWISEQKDG